MKSAKIALFAVSIFCCLTMSTGCKKKQAKKQNTEEQISITLSPSSEIPEAASGTNLHTQHWHETNKRICVLFGYNFNDDDTVNNYLYVLQKEFGLDSDGGLIYPLIFPASFKHGTNSYASDLKEILKTNFKDTDLIGLIILGAPENTHIALENLQDDNDLVYPIFAFFPQDNNFGLESTCNLIVEKAQNLENENESDEQNNSAIANAAPDILVNSISYMLILDEMKLSINNIENEGDAVEGVITDVFPADSSMIEHVAQILKGHTFKNYVDHDTGISSFNHFVID